MGLRKSGFKYLSWGYIEVIAIAALFSTLVTKSHDPISSPNPEPQTPNP